MNHVESDRVPWGEAPGENFTGQAWFGPLHRDEDADGMQVLAVKFSPGARADWHSHPGGQVLYVVSGSARVGNADGEMVEAGPGDAVHAMPGELHWHGAAPDGEMVHLSITHGGATEWTGRAVSDEEYGPA